MVDPDDNDLTKSLQHIEEASKLLPGYCDAVNDHSPEFANELVARMRSNLRLMEKVHSFLKWRSGNPLPKSRLRPEVKEIK